MINIIVIPDLKLNYDKLLIKKKEKGQKTIHNLQQVSFDRPTGEFILCVFLRDNIDLTNSFSSLYIVVLYF